MRSTATAGRGIEIHLREMNQLFDSLDPSPFHEKDLDRNAEQYIVDSAKELPGRSPADLVIVLDRAPGPDDEATAVKAIHAHFERRSQHLRRELRRLMRRGGISLGIGLTALIVLFLTGHAVVRLLGPGGGASLLRESLLIGGWVAMWRPLEIFLYDWWPIVGEIRINRKLSTIGVRVLAAAARR